MEEPITHHAPVKPHTPSDQGLVNISTGISELAAAVKEFPKHVAEQAQLTTRAFEAGVVAGGGITLVLALVIALLFRRQ